MASCFFRSILLFKDGSVLKLCDFGTAKKLEHTLTNAVGTIRYMAPEVIRGVCVCVCMYCIVPFPCQDQYGSETNVYQHSPRAVLHRPL